MKVRHDEGLANHIGPEPCVDIREGVGEASVGEYTGQPLSRDRISNPNADAVTCSGRQHDRARHSRAPVRFGVVIDPGMCRRSLYGNRDISGSARRKPGPHREGLRP